MESRLGQGGSHVWSFYGLKSGTAWCAAEISYTFNKVGAKAKWYGGKPVFYVPWAQEWMAKNWECVYDYRYGGSLKNAKKGDIVIFMWSRGSRDHIGAVRSDSTSASQILTIEGNTSGSKVAKRTRAKANVFAIYRPPWVTQNTPKPSQTATKPSQSTQKTEQTAKKTSTPTYTKGKTYAVQVDNLNVRTGAGTGYKVKSKNPQMWRRKAFRMTAIDGKKYLVGTGARPFPVIKESNPYPDKATGSTLMTVTVTWKSLHGMLRIL